MQRKEKKKEERHGCHKLKNNNNNNSNEPAFPYSSSSSSSSSFSSKMALPSTCLDLYPFPNPPSRMHAENGLLSLARCVTSTPMVRMEAKSGYQIPAVPDACPRSQDTGVANKLLSFLDLFVPSVSFSCHSRRGWPSSVHLSGVETVRQTQLRLSTCIPACGDLSVALRYPSSPGIDSFPEDQDGGDGPACQ